MTTKNQNNRVVFHNLERIRFVMQDATSLDIAYAYDDLVFSDNALFVIQFNAANENVVSCWFNSECFENARLSMQESLSATAKLNGLIIEYKGKFKLITEGQEEDSFCISFLPKQIA